MTKTELKMLMNWCETEKHQGYIQEGDFFKKGYNQALNHVIYFLEDLKKDLDE